MIEITKNKQIWNFAFENVDLYFDTCGKISFFNGSISAKLDSFRCFSDYNIINIPPDLPIMRLTVLKSIRDYRLIPIKTIYTVEININITELDIFRATIFNMEYMKLLLVLDRINKDPKLCPNIMITT